MSAPVRRARWLPAEVLALQHVFGPKGDDFNKAKLIRQYGKAAAVEALTQARKMKKMLAPNHDRK